MIVRMNSNCGVAFAAEREVAVGVELELEPELEGQLVVVTEACWQPADAATERIW